MSFISMEVPIVLQSNLKQIYSKSTIVRARGLTPKVCIILYFGFSLKQTKKEMTLVYTVNSLYMVFQEGAKYLVFKHLKCHVKQPHALTTRAIPARGRDHFRYELKLLQNI